MDKPKKGTYGYNKEYAKKYVSKFSVFKVRFSQEQKERLDDAAARAGESVNHYVIKAVEARIQKEG